MEPGGTATIEAGRPPSALRRRLAQSFPLSPEEDAFIADLERADCRFSAGDEVAEEGQAAKAMYVVRKGWAIRYKSLENGSRLIVDFILPGEFAYLGAAMLETADESVAAVTDIVVTPITVERLSEAFRQHQGLAIALMRLNARQAAFLTERLVSVARRSALQSIAHLLVQLWSRHRLLAGPDQAPFQMPVTQVHLADCLGLSPVHVNRMLRRLREGGLVQVRRGEILIVDPAGLKAMADFDDWHAPSRQRG